MKKLEFEMYFDGNLLQIINEQFVLEQCREMFKEGRLDASVEPEFNWKSSEQLAYLFGGIAPALLSGLRARGYGLKNKHDAVSFAMLQEEVGCVEVVVDEFSGDVLARVPRRISGLSRGELSQLMSDLIMFCEIELGVEVLSPEQYKEQRKFKK